MQYFSIDSNWFVILNLSKSVLEFLIVLCTSGTCPASLGNFLKFYIIGIIIL